MDDQYFDQVPDQVPDQEANPRCPRRWGGRGSTSTKPIPCDLTAEDEPLDAWGIFVPPVLTRIFDWNAGWLQERSRSTSEILETLFPEFDWAGMTRVAVLIRINNALWDKGYSFSTPEGADPFWTFPSPTSPA